MRFREIRRSSWWRLGELCEVPRCLLWRELRRHCPTSFSMTVSIFHSTWLGTFGQSLYRPWHTRSRAAHNLLVFLLNRLTSTSSSFLVFPLLTSLHCSPSLLGWAKIKCISFLVVVWSVDLHVCALPDLKVNGSPPHPWALNGAKRWGLFFYFIITMLTYGALEKILKAASTTSDLYVIHSSCECH